MSTFHFQVAVSGSPPSSCRISHFNISEDATISAGNLGRGMRLFEFLKGKGAASLGWAQSNATIDYDYNRLHIYHICIYEYLSMRRYAWHTLVHISAYTFTWLYSDILCMAIRWTESHYVGCVPALPHVLGSTIFAKAGGGRESHHMNRLQFAMLKEWLTDSSLCHTMLTGFAYFTSLLFQQHTSTLSD